MVNAGTNTIHERDVIRGVRTGAIDHSELRDNDEED